MHLTSLIVATAAVFAVGTQAQQNPYQIGVLPERFCMHLPPKKGSSMNVDKQHAVAFCSDGNYIFRGARPFVKGFILSSHYNEDTVAGYVQSFGQMDANKYFGNKTCEIGHYSNKDNPSTSSSCYQHEFYLSIVDTTLNKYGVRCCDKQVDCDYETVKNTFFSSGDVSGPNPDTPRCVNGKVVPANYTIPVATGTTASIAQVTTGTAAPSAPTVVGNKQSSGVRLLNAASTTAVLAVSIAYMMV